MTLDPFLLEMLACPETRTPLQQADGALVALLVASQQKGRLQNRAGRPVDGPITGALVRAAGDVAYLIRDGLPVLLIDEQVALNQVR